MGLNYKKDGHIATFTFENGKVNPLTPKMHKELFFALKDFLADDSIRCGIMTGAGDHGFSAGDDIKTTSAKDASPQEQLADHLWPHRNEGEDPETFAWSRDVLQIDRFKPIVAAVNGWCLGQAMIYLTHLTDIRIASKNAKFGFPEVAYGMGGAGGTTRLGRHLPHTVAMWMLLTGEPLSAEDALKYNLVNRVVEHEDLLDSAKEVADRIAKHDPIGVRIEMEAYYRCADLSRTDAMAFTKHLYRMQRLGLGAYDGESIGDTPFLYSARSR